MVQSTATVITKLALGLVAGLALSACSVAGLKNLMPVKAKSTQARSLGPAAITYARSVTAPPTWGDPGTARRASITR